MRVGTAVSPCSRPASRSRAIDVQHLDGARRVEVVVHRIHELRAGAAPRAAGRAARRAPRTARRSSAARCSQRFELVRAPVVVGAVVRAAAGRAAPRRASAPARAGRSPSRGCRATSTSSRRPASACRRASTCRRTAPSPVAHSRLHDLRLVVREAQVLAAAVDIDAVAEVSRAPSRSTRCASPAGLRPRARASARPASLLGCQSRKSSGSRFRCCGSAGMLSLWGGEVRSCAGVMPLSAPKRGAVFESKNTYPSTS